MTLLEGIAILPGCLEIFRIFSILKGTIHFLFARRTFLTKEAAVTHFSGDERIVGTHTHILTNNFRKMNEMLGQMLCSLLENGPKGNGKDCVFKGSKLVADSFRQVKATSGKADNRLTS